MHSAKTFVYIFLLATLIVLCVSCGVSGGGGGGSSPSSSHSPATDDPTQNYFSFNTEAAKNYADYGSGYKGITVYYKIYTSTSTLLSHYSIIAAETTGEGGKNKLESDQLRYQKLNSEGKNGADYVISSAQTNQSVEIRLFNETAYTRCIKIDGADSGTPARYLSGKSFQFSSTEYPRTGDGDFNGSETSTGPWYVAAYAVSVSQSELALSPDVFSKPKYLGYIKIYY